MQNDHTNPPAAIAAIDRAIDLVESVLAKPGRLPTGKAQEMRQHLPYCLHSVPGQDARILCNRNYKPVGTPREDNAWADYTQHSDLWIWIRDEQLEDATNDTGKWLFDDGNAPWAGKREAETYLALLKALRAHLGAEQTAEA
jgi:hypothetical protein